MEESKTIHYQHEVVYYVPCFQKGKTFEYTMAHATIDEQLALSMEPDYVLVLTGKFDVKTQPYSEEIVKYNKGIK